MSMLQLLSIKKSAASLLHLLQRSAKGESQMECSRQAHPTAQRRDFVEAALKILPDGVVKHRVAGGGNEIDIAASFHERAGEALVIKAQRKPKGGVTLDGAKAMSEEIPRGEWRWMPG